MDINFLYELRDCLEKVFDDSEEYIRQLLLVNDLIAIIERNGE